MTLPPDQPEPMPPARKPRKPRSTPSAKATATAKPVGAASRAKAAAAVAVPGAARDWPLRLVGIVALVTIALDQATKWLVVRHLDLTTRREIDVIDPFLNLRMAWNEGVNFGLLASGAAVMRWVLVGIAVAVCVWVAAWVQRGRPGRLARVAAGLLIGGALGNVIDRVAYGAVADFINTSLPGWSNPYSFNLADIAIFAGAIGLVLQPQPRVEAAKVDKPRDGRGKTG